jgi:hypothetical protein
MSVDLNDPHELSLDELEAVAGGFWPELLKEAGKLALQQAWPTLTKAIGQDVLKFAASQGVR